MAGLAVDIGSRVMGAAGAEEVVASSTVKTLGYQTPAAMLAAIVASTP